MRTNIARAKEALRALEAYTGREVPVICNDPEANDASREDMSDLLTDLLHLMHFGGLDLDHEIEAARTNLDEELDEERTL